MISLTIILRVANEKAATTPQSTPKKTEPSDSECPDKTIIPSTSIPDNINDLNFNGVFKKNGSKTDVIKGYEKKEITAIATLDS